MKKTEDNEQRLKAIGDRLKELRKERGFPSYEVFAYEKGINRVQYGRMESGSNMTITTLMRVVDAYELTLEEFFKGLK